jgi:L-alanine-DL-glutamate epimerase-like enolase superfamily enzyme
MLHAAQLFRQTGVVEIQTRTVELHPRGAFRIARERRVPFANVLLRVERDGIVGWGEASPNPFYGVSAEDVRAKLRDAADWLRGVRIQSVPDIEFAWAESWALLRPHRAAQCALDLALWDWLARRQGVSVCELASGRAPHPVTSFATIGLGAPEEFEAKLAALRGFPRVKLKSDARADLEPLRRVRARTGAEVAVDANCAWPARDLAALSAACAAAGATFIEQPLPPAQDAGLVRGSCALPVFADESCVHEEDVERLAKHFDGINVKLVKCGGLTPALRMLRRARELGLRTMVGCMLETSVLIAAGCVAAQIADYADLDGAWLIADDPCAGWRWEKGVLHPPPGAGLGAEPFA